MGRNERRANARYYREYRKTRPFNSITSLVATAIFAYFIVLPLLIGLFTRHFGNRGEVLTNLIDLLPFGGVYRNLAVQFINGILNQIFGLVSSQQPTLTVIPISFGYICGELAKGFFTVIAFEFLNGVVFMVTGLDEPYGCIDHIKSILIMVIDALIAACLAPFPMQYIVDHVKKLGTVGSSVVSLLLVVILVGGGIAFIFFSQGKGLLDSALYVLIKFILMGACRISMSYFSLFLIIEGCKSGAYYAILPGVAGLLGIGLMLSGIEIMISGAMK